MTNIPTNILAPLFEKLTPREQAFVMHPKVMTDPVQAARDVGYAETTAKNRSHYMRTQLFFYIAPIHEWRMMDANLDVKRIIAELNAIAFANESDYYDTVDVDGETIKVLKDFTRIPEPMQRAIKSIELDTIVYPGYKSTDGEDHPANTVQVVKRIQLHDKLAALKELKEISGMADPRLRKAPQDDSQDAEILENLEPEEVELMNRMLQKGVARAQAKREKAIIDVTPQKKLNK